MFSAFQEPEGRVVHAINSVHRLKYGYPMQYYCPRVERDLIQRSPGRGDRWPVRSPRWEETEAFFRLYELVWKYQFIKHVMPLYELQRVVHTRDRYRLPLSAMDLPVIVDWEPTESHGLRSTFLDGIRNKAWTIAFEEASRERPWYGDRPYNAEEIQSLVSSDDSSRDWFAYARDKWGHMLDQMCRDLGGFWEEDNGNRM